MATLLLVEDDPLQHVHMKALLEDLGHNVALARDAAEALSALQGDQPFDLVILDVMLPLAGAFDDGQGGLEAGIEILRRIRQDHAMAHRRNVPVLCYTVRGVTARIRQALEGLNGKVLEKGVDPEEVLATIDGMLVV